MGDLTTPGRARIPEPCTLPTSEQPLRLAEFDALFARAVRDGERLGPQRLRLTLAGDAMLAAAVRDLTARETECCSFFAFAVAAGAPGLVQLDITVPVGYVDVLDTLAEQAAVARSRQ